MFFISSRTAAAIRTASMTCVQALLQGELLSSDQLSAMLEDLLPKVRTSLYRCDTGHVYKRV